jgi:hypothetical protein
MSGSRFVFPHSGSASPSPITTGSMFIFPQSGSITTTPSTTGSMVVRPQSGSIIISIAGSGSTIDYPKSGSFDYASRANKSFKNIHSLWGTSSADVQFINYAGRRNHPHSLMLSQTSASLSFTFIQSASLGSTIQLVVVL